MIDPQAIVADRYADRLVEQEQPREVDPMLATLTRDHFSDPEWVFERKLDGERCLAFRSGETVRLMSRNELDIGDQYPEIVEALSAQEERDFVLDGELVAFEGGTTSFSRLQGRMHLHAEDPFGKTGIRVYYYVFDIVHLSGFGLEDLPLRERKRVLRRALRFEDPLRFTPHRNEDGEAYLEEACEKGWEGLIAKDARSAYVHTRSRSWLKFKCSHGQELVIGGYTDPQGSRIGFGALLLGYYDGEEFVYAGKVGTGFDEDTLEWLHGKLVALERETGPFDRGEPETEGAHFVTPKLIAEIGFTEWTSEGKLRHPRYLGLRRDKDARDVVREEPDGGSR